MISRADWKPNAQETEGDEVAKCLLDDARGRVDEMLGDARREAERIREEARREFLEAAGKCLERALEEAARGQVEEFQRARESLVAEIRRASEERAEQLERDVFGLVSVMAGKVVQRNIDEEDGVVRDVVRATIAQAAGAKRLTVRIAPAEEECVRAAQAELLRAADGSEELEIVADDAISPGGCIVETERGRFDARISTQLELLQEEIARVLGD